MGSALRGLGHVARGTIMAHLPAYGHFPGGSVGKESACSAGDAGSIPGSGRGHGNPLQYSGLENLMDRGAWPATAHRVAKCWTRLKGLSTHVSACGSE